METEEKELCRRMEELSRRALDRNAYEAGTFLTDGEQALLSRLPLPLPPRFEGGYPEAERRLPFFGSEELFGWAEEPPIVCLCIAPTAPKFAEALTHRDYLGALMNLGIRREFLGDLLLCENRAYLFALDRIAPHIAENLEKVRHTPVKSRTVKALPVEARVHLEEREVVAASPRLDGMVAAVFDLSRSEAKALAEKEKISVNSLLVADPAHILREGDRVSVRGYGRFYFDSPLRETRSGRTRFAVRVFV